jgi:chromate reductase
MDQMPPFNPDLEALHESGPVGRFRSAVCGARVVVFCTPEYAHGIPGSLKIAPDWMVGSGEFSPKPVALLPASSRGDYVQAALREVLRTVNA